MRWLKDLFVGNWRNKGVALFFAVMIWYVSYQAEKKDIKYTIRVALRAEGDYVLTQVLTDQVDEGDAQRKFVNKVTIVLAGPRKLIDAVEAEIKSKIQDPDFKVDVGVPAGSTRFAFEGSDFDFIPEGVDVVSIEPRSLTVLQEELGTKNIANPAEFVTVVNIPDGYEYALRELVPASQEVSIRAPRSILEQLGVSIRVVSLSGRDSFEGMAEVLPTSRDPTALDLYAGTVNVSPSQVRVRVGLRASMEGFAVEAMRITFRIPPTKIPLKILLDDVVGDTIPVEFYGRRDDISRLRERLREQPGFSLGVRVPPFDRDTGGQFTFTEDILELHGFPGVQIRQHESRRREKKTAWSYTIVPGSEAAP